MLQYSMTIEDPVPRHDQFSVTSDFNTMFKKLYWSQIFNRKTTWEVKKIAIKSLWIMWRMK